MLGTTWAGATRLCVPDDLAILANTAAVRLGPLRTRTEAHRLSDPPEIVAVQRFCFLETLILALGAFADRVEILSLADADRLPRLVSREIGPKARDVLSVCEVCFGKTANDHHAGRNGNPKSFPSHSFSGRTCEPQSMSWC